jgi:DNA modification methylase
MILPPQDLVDKIHFDCCYDLIKKIPDNSVSLVITDPPYGIKYQNLYTHQKFDIIDGDEKPFSYLQIAREFYRVLKDNSCIFIYTGWSTYPQHFQEIRAAGFKMREPLIVQKRASGTHDLYGSFQSNADWLLFAHKGRFHFQNTELMRNKRAGTVPNKGRKPTAEFKTRFPACWFGDSYPYSTENPAKKIQHPTPKSSEFISWLIKLCSEENDIVLDPFAGSGSTGIACKETSRRFILSENNREYYETANARLQSAQQYTTS